jgi:hypothetical protein
MTAGSRYPSAGIESRALTGAAPDVGARLWRATFRLHIARFAHIPAERYRLPPLNAGGSSKALPR